MNDTFFMPVVARYVVVVDYDKKRSKGGLHDAALRMADEQSLSIRGVSRRIREILGIRKSDLKEYEANVSRIDVVHRVDEGDKRRYFGVVEIEYPEVHFLSEDGPSFMLLLAIIAGDLMDSIYLKRIQLKHLRLPDRMVEFFGGPKRAERLRRLWGSGPYLALIMKPSLGLTNDQFASIVRRVAKAGIHMVTDDEKLADTPYSRRIERAIKAVREIKAVGADTVYFVNVSSQKPAEVAKRIVEAVPDVERIGILIPSMYAGYDTINEVRKELDIPIYTRNSGFSALTEGPRSVSHGLMAYLERLAGSDIVQVPPIVGVHKKDPEIVREAIEGLTLDDRMQRSIPLMGAGIQPARAYRAVSMGFKDVLFLVGRAIVGHPLGPEAGVKAMFDAFKGALEGLTIRELTEKSKEFKIAYQLWGERT